MKFISNKEIAKLLRSVAAAYTVKNGPFFKINAYQNAADSLEHATQEARDLWEQGNLDTIPGLGKGIQTYLGELFKTGRVKHFDQIKSDLPQGMFELMAVGGIGPKTAYKLAKELKIKNIADLEKVAKAKKIRQLEGFGQKSEEEILASLSEYKNRSERHVLPFAFETAERVLQYLRKIRECERAEPLGSLRRMVSTVGDVDIAVASKSAKKIISEFTKYPEISRILGAGPISSSVLLKNGVQVDLKVMQLDSFGSLLQHFTGSKNHNIRLREYALKKKMSLSEYGILYKKKTHKFEDEENFYKFLGMEWIEPELREDSGEIEASIKHELPKVVSLEDIKGDIHIHSNYPIEPSHDLGQESFAEIVEKAKSKKYEYIGFSDHSPGFSTHTRKQLIELIKKRTRKIEQLKSSEKSIRILNLLEIDILTSGELSVPDEGLRLLDGAIAGIHSSHSQDKKTITKRLLVAINNPYVQVISHPTGRLLGQRESYEADWPQVFEACAKTKTLLEINAWPNRLDLPDTLVKEAKNYKVKFVINTDSHAISQMDNMKFGVATARRGWATKSDIVNTLPWLEFCEIFNV